ncbi:sulfurtransferase, partial [Methylobacterium radiotolerans]
MAIAAGQHPLLAAASAPLGARTVEFTISDGVKTSAPLSYTVDVISSAPALSSPSTGPVSFAAGDNTSSSPVVIDGGLLLASPLGNVVDSAVSPSREICIPPKTSSSFVNNGLTMGDITGSYNVLTGVLTLNSASGTATLAQWQAALRSITYADTRVSPNTATRTISFAVNAGPQFSNVVTRDITVTATDQTPLISSGSTGAASFVAGDNTASTPVTVDSGIALSTSITRRW